VVAIGGKFDGLLGHGSGSFLQNGGSSTPFRSELRAALPTVGR
jgi:hypothetical protein